MPQDPSAALSNLEMLSEATSDEVALLSSLMTLEAVPAGFELSRQGDKGDRFWVVMAGTLEVTMSTGKADRRIAVAAQGAILGELSLLRDAPRSATIRALEDCLLVSGGPDALEALIDIESARQRIQAMASTRLAEDCRPIPVTLRDGQSVLLRPLLPTDRANLTDAIRNLSAESLRRRFFSPTPPSQKLIDYLVDIDFVDHFAWVAIDSATGEGMATARYVRTAVRGQAEIAFTTTDSNQGRGLGTVMLGAIGVAATQAGVDRLVAHVLDDNTAMRAVFAKADGVTSRDEPGVVSVSIESVKAASLLEPEIRTEIADSVRDIVTAASLALVEASD